MKMGKQKSPPPPAPPAPEGLSEKSRRLWTAAFSIKRQWNAARLEVLHQALRALDRSDEAREAVSREGLVTTTATTGATHLNPCVRVEREMRAQALKAFEQLGLLSLGSLCGPTSAMFDSNEDF
jgi:phage terminase small subunit